MAYFSSFEPAIEYATATLKSSGAMVDTGRWQGVETQGKPDLQTKELLNLSFSVGCERVEWHDSSERTLAAAYAAEINPNLPWADEHFEERIGGRPLNPDPSHEHWPWWTPEKTEYTNALESVGAEFKFTHTYSERFWPLDGSYTEAQGIKSMRPFGVRYQFGNYDDLLDLLEREPYTRQAYLPIFFPEDTGAVHRGRIPCTLGYHFLLRSNRLHMWYAIRSCDAIRHFRDDLYLAARLLAYTLNELFERELRSDRDQIWVNVDPGILYFTAHSFHIHMGDYHRL